MCAINTLYKPLSSTWSVLWQQCLISGTNLSLCCGDKHHDQKQLGKKRFVSTSLSIPSPREVGPASQGRNLEAGSEAEATEECCWLACSSDSVTLLSKQPRATCLGHRRLDPPTHLATGQSDEGIFSMEILSSHRTLVHMKLIVTNNQLHLWILKWHLNS